MKLRARRGREGSSGQAMVEFALVVPILVVLLFGIIDLGLYVYSTNSLNEISRESARFGAVALRPSSCAGKPRADCVRSLAKEKLVGVPIDTTDVGVVCQRRSAAGSLPASPATDNCAGTWRGGDLMRVTIERDFTLVTPVIGQLVGSLRMRAEALVTVNG
jgi:Flp pilus assembly protein TadG